MSKLKDQLKMLKDAGKGVDGGGADMSTVASDKTKKEAKKYLGRGDGVKKLNRSFTSLMNEKYMR